MGVRSKVAEDGVWRSLERAVDRLLAGFDRVRRWSRKLDHFIRAYERYDEVHGGRLAAANAYYGFFAIFALGVLLFGILGYVLRDNQLVLHALQAYLEANLPNVKTETLIGTIQTVGKLALVGLALAGVGWVETLRSSQRAIWGFEQQPGNFIVRWLVDSAVLTGLGLLLTVSVSIAAGVQDLLLALAGEPSQSGLRILLNQTSTLLAFIVDLILGAGLLSGVAQVRMPMRRLFPSALLVAFGLLALKTLGRWYITRTQHNPAYQVFAGAVGLLVFMYLFSQIVLYAAALAATSRHGLVRDLAAGPPPELPVTEEPVAEDKPGVPDEPAPRREPESTPTSSG